MNLAYETVVVEIMEITPILTAKSSDPLILSPRARALTPQALTSVGIKQEEVTQAPLEKAVPVSTPATVASSTNSASASDQIWDKGVLALMPCPFFFLFANGIHISA